MIVPITPFRDYTFVYTNSKNTIEIDIKKAPTISKAVKMGRVALSKKVKNHQKYKLIDVK